MRYFTDNPLERMMMQIPSAAREDPPPAAHKGHQYHGCNHSGQDCVRPCYRDVRRKAVKPCAL